MLGDYKRFNARCKRVIETSVFPPSQAGPQRATVPGKRPPPPPLVRSLGVLELMEPEPCKAYLTVTDGFKIAGPEHNRSSTSLRRCYEDCCCDCAAYRMDCFCHADHLRCYFVRTWRVPREFLPGNRIG